MGKEPIYPQTKNRHLKKILALLEENPYITLRELGEYCGVTRERIRQILEMNGIVKEYGNRINAAYSTLVLEHKSIVDIVEPTEFTQTITNSHFDPLSPDFLGIELQKIATSQIYIRKNNHKHALLNFPTSAEASRDLRIRKLAKKRWRCYICRPLYTWQYINNCGELDSISLTKPCTTCGKPVTRNGSLLHRILKDGRYVGGFYCDRKCFYHRKD